MSATAAWAAVFAPLAGALVTPLAARFGPAARTAAALAGPFVSAVAALRLLPALLDDAGLAALPVESAVAWIEAPVRIGFGLLIDPLSIVLTNVVAVVSFIILIYCVGYMRGDPGETRFWMWMNGFIGSMLLLVLADNLLWLFVGWKLVGVCSFGLIGYYYEDQRKYWIGGPAPTPFVTPSEAGLKALLVTGAGDMLMLGGILLLYFHAGTLNFAALHETAPTWLAAMAERPGLLILVSLLLLAGPLGKSAQFPFHEWLPEAMAGPGPVSALIHAATMVKSGVYLVARLVPLFHYGYWTAEIAAAGWFFHVTAWLGAFTALLAATQGMVARELKKVLACSTVSQIGYMMLGLGAAGLAPGLLLDGYTAGIFHLVGHALFKACLFLCAATVIHAVHSLYVDDMGGVRRYLPITWGCMLVAALSLMGVPPFPGFWSKDAVLLVVHEASGPLFAVALATAGITAFYTVRFFVLVFHGTESAGLASARAHDPSHLHDGDRTMLGAAGVLAVLIVAAGVAAPGLEAVLHHGFASSLGASTAASAGGAPEAAGDAHLFVVSLSLLFIAAGAGVAGYVYLSGRTSPESILASDRPLAALHGFFWRRWGIDAFYERVFVGGTTRLAQVVADEIETRWDRLVHESLPRAVLTGIAPLVRRLRADTEELDANVSYVVAAFAVLLAILLLWTGGG